MDTSEAARLQQRLAGVESELVEASKWLIAGSAGWFPNSDLRRRVDALYGEEAALRTRLGLPPREPPGHLVRTGPAGWIVLVGAVVIIVAGLWLTAL